MMVTKRLKGTGIYEMSNDFRHDFLRVGACEYPDLDRHINRQDAGGQFVVPALKVQLPKT